MTSVIYQVDAFTDKLFGGNPAAVCPLSEWLPDTRMQNIAMENNLAETAFYVKKGDVYEIRWFTPAVEVDLCGHATLASAFIIFTEQGYTHEQINFHSPRSGELIVTKNGEELTLNFPADETKELKLDDDIRSCFNHAPTTAYTGRIFLLVEFDTEDEVKNLTPDFFKLKKLNYSGIIATAKGNEVDFVSRFFAPRLGIDEDPVTGAAHTTLIPFWSRKLNKKNMSARQISPRSGKLNCTFMNDRVLIGGTAILYLRGEIYLP